MKRLSRFLVLLLPAALEVGVAVVPGHAQQETSSRYAFADTTLLRDTLDLHFNRLFPLADSLGLTADTLRALSIRYRWTLSRLVWLADSLRMPVDSVGPYLDRERFNPLSAVAGQRVTSLQYNSTYNIAQTSTSWLNAADYKLTAGPLFVQNTTNIQMDRYLAGSQTSLRQTRTSITEAGWKFSPGFSLGSRADLERFTSMDPGSIDNQGESKNEFQFSVRTRQTPSKALRSEVNLFTGLLDLSNFEQIKKGASGDLNGTVRFQSKYVTHDLTGQVTGNLAHTRYPTNPANLGTNDLSNNLRGTLGLMPSQPLGLNVTYILRHIRVETPTDSGTIQQVLTNNGEVDATMRLRVDNDRQLTIGGSLTSQDQNQGGLLNSRTGRRGRTLNLNGRYLLLGWGLESRFSLGRTRSDYPTKAITNKTMVGYGESLRVASFNATATRNFGPRISVKLEGNVNLNSYRYFLIGDYPNPPVNRDQYRQEYRIDGQYNVSKRITSGLALDVSRNVLVNITAGSTSSNDEVNAYRAEWRWNYHMMPGLTASQNNAIEADYTHYNFLLNHDQASFSYSSVTTLNAVLSPRFNLDLRHNLQHRPSGTYVLDVDGVPLLSRTEVSDNSTISVRVSYQPFPGLSLNLQPDFLASQNLAAQSGVLSPTRTSRTLNFSGGASLNVPLGTQGRLTGDILRSYRADRTTSYSSLGVSSPLNEIDFWNGSLQLSWQM
jgi:hypothetical protein